MPELPEVETVLRGLKPYIEGKRITRLIQNRANLRFPFPDRFKERVEGKTIALMTRRAKFLLFQLDSNETLLSHLGMSGSFRLDTHTIGDFSHARNKQKAHDHIVMEFDGVTLTYNDPRRFGLMDLYSSSHKMLDILGVEPFSNGLNAAYLYEKGQGKSSPLKSFLLDQSVIAGLGNIYVCEALYKTRISPFRKASSLTLLECEFLITAIRDILARAIEAGGSSLKDHAQVNGELGYFSHEFSVYGRENLPCPACNSLIIRAKQGGRSTFYCEGCQK